MKENQIAITTIGLILALTFSLPFIRTLIPQNSETYLVMAILGQEGDASQYYPNNDPTIQANIPVRWYVYLHNHQNSSQLVLLKIKLLNSTHQSPNSTLGQPNPDNPFIEYTYTLAGNETEINPFLWQVTRVTYDGNTVTINELMVNDSSFNTNTRAVNGMNFRLVFELWYYDEALQEFRFARQVLEKNVCVWNQIWFNIN